MSLVGLVLDLSFDVSLKPFAFGIERLEVSWLHRLAEERLGLEIPFEMLCEVLHSFEKIVGLCSHTARLPKTFNSKSSLRAEVVGFEPTLRFSPDWHVSSVLP